MDLSGTSCDVIDCGQTTQDILKTLIATQEGKENFSLAIMEEIEKLPEYKQTKTLLEELKTRTCICKKICTNERGLKVHKRKCDVAKNALTRESSTSSSTSENSMMMQMMNANTQMIRQMQEDRNAQKEQLKAQQEQTKLLTKLLEEKDKTANEMLKKVSENHLEQQRIANVRFEKCPEWSKNQDLESWKQIVEVWEDRRLEMRLEMEMEMRLKIGDGDRRWR